MRRQTLFWGDVVILYLSLFLALFIRYGADPRYVLLLRAHLVPFSIIFAVWLLVFYIANLYDIQSAKNNYEFYSTLTYSFLTNALFSILFFYFIHFFNITPKTNLFIFLVVSGILLASWRYYFNRLSARNTFGNNTLFLGLSPQSQQIYDHLLANPQLGYNALGIIDTAHYSAPEILEKIIAEKDVKTLILGPEAYLVPRIINILYKFVGKGMVFYNLSYFYEMATGKVPLGAIDQAWFLANLSENSKRAYEVGKKVFDIIFAVIIGLVFTVLLPFIILAIKLDSPGPIFYRQKRIGRSGKIFTLIKLRTMGHDVEKKTGPVWASANDSRRTRVGRFLRRTRIDEVPQIWNIIRGDMSFVGPRPERPEFHSKLQEDVPFYEERCLIKPGLTGWAQINYKLDFRDGMTVQDTFEKVQHDLYYIKNRTLLLDAGIVLKTINIILQKLFSKTKKFITDQPTSPLT
jgi:exopolysaccharide biosynthesis polyprenyl glycosylphosphotransferase